LLDGMVINVIVWFAENPDKS